LATPEAIESYVRFVAAEVRELLASLGLRCFEDAVGRADLLRPKRITDRRGASLDLRTVLAARRGRFDEQAHLAAEGGELGELLASDSQPVLDEARILELRYPITNRDRAVGARLGGEIGRRFGEAAPPGRVRARFEGAAGQSFGAFLAAGVELQLVGEANDYVGKGMGGGRIVVVPPPDDAGDPVLLGNTVLYGATGGELFCAGRAGERFAVRNSGASAVVEGVGDHACEYMTAGCIVVLGDTGLNFGAGMSGGVAYVLDPPGRLPLRLNSQLVTAERAAPDDLRELLERHVRHTGSLRASTVLDAWSRAAHEFWRVAPRERVAATSSRATIEAAAPTQGG
jgi:glutamate synthase domain-containing protein 3